MIQIVPGRACGRRLRGEMKYCGWLCCDGWGNVVSCKMSCHVIPMWCDAMWCDVRWCHVMSCLVMWCDFFVPCHIRWCHAMSCDVLSCVVGCEVMLCDRNGCVMWWTGRRRAVNCTLETKESHTVLRLHTLKYYPVLQNSTPYYEVLFLHHSILQTTTPYYNTPK